MELVDKRKGPAPPPRLGITREPGAIPPEEFLGDRASAEEGWGRARSFPANSRRTGRFSLSLEKTEDRGAGRGRTDHPFPHQPAGLFFGSCAVCRLGSDFAPCRRSLLLRRRRGPRASPSRSRLPLPWKPALLHPGWRSPRLPNLGKLCSAVRSSGFRVSCWETRLQPLRSPKRKKVLSSLKTAGLARKESVRPAGFVVELIFVERVKDSLSDFGRFENFPLQLHPPPLSLRGAISALFAGSGPL